MGMNVRRSWIHSGVVALMVVFIHSLGAFAQQETAKQIVDRAAKAHDNQWTQGKMSDWAGSGKIVITGDTNGPLDFTLIVKQNGRIKRVVKTPGGNVAYGSDGKKTWHKTGPFQGEAKGIASYFIESQTNRSIARFFDKANSVKDIGPPDKKAIPKSSDSRIVEAKNDKGQSTRYFIDDTTSLIRRLEFDTGATYRMLFGDTEYPVYASFLFSDYRNINGIMTPFKIQVYQGMIKVEEMTFSTVQYNIGVSDDQLEPDAVN